MISCSVSKGNTNSPISTFTCLEHDIPFLPKNNPQHIIEDIHIDLTNLLSINFKQNTIINRVIFDKLIDNTEYIQFKKIKVFGYNNDGDNIQTTEYNVDNFPIIKSHYFGLFTPSNTKISMKNYKVLNGKLDLLEFLKLELKALQKINSNVTKIDKINIVINCIKNDTTEEKEISFNIQEKEYIELNKEHYVKYYFPDGQIPNGSIALVMDTSEVYIFDLEYDKWRKL